MPRMTWGKNGLHKSFDPNPLGGWPAVCQHTFRDGHEFIQLGEIRSYRCIHCQEIVQFKPQTWRWAW
jgi:hypothetical protein